MLTTGGGWQDQIGGVVDGLKLVRTLPGMVPKPEIEFIPHGVLEPADNGGRTLLYYTGITRLAKNILGKVVGRYLDRQPSAMATLTQIRELAPRTAAAVARRDLPAFGECIHEAWSLNKQLDPDSSNQEVEEILARVRPYVYGAKLLGAGGGGFLLLVCRSPRDAAKIRADLEARPPNSRARFFQFHVNLEGLRVSTC
jgi:fucokinase